MALVNGFVETGIVFVDEYGSEKIRATRRAGCPYQIPDVREILALGQRALETDFVRPVRVKEHAEEEDVQQALAPRRLLDGNVVVQPRRLRSVMVPLADDPRP